MKPATVQCKPAGHTINTAFDESIAGKTVVIFCRGCKQEVEAEMPND